MLYANFECTYIKWECIFKSCLVHTTHSPGINASEWHYFTTDLYINLIYLFVILLSAAVAYSSHIRDLYYKLGGYTICILMLCISSTYKRVNDTSTTHGDI